MTFSPADGAEILVQIPATVTPGTYYIGGKLDATGVVSGNTGTTLAWSASQITITAKPTAQGTHTLVGDTLIAFQTAGTGGDPLPPQVYINQFTSGTASTKASVISGDQGTTSLCVYGHGFEHRDDRDLRRNSHASFCDRDCRNVSAHGLRGRAGWHVRPVCDSRPQCHQFDCQRFRSTHHHRRRRQLSDLRQCAHDDVRIHLYDDRAHQQHPQRHRFLHLHAGGGCRARTGHGISSDDSNGGVGTMFLAFTASGGGVCFSPPTPPTPAA